MGSCDRSFFDGLVDQMLLKVLSAGGRQAGQSSRRAALAPFKV